jgi:hypothetical protein
VVLAEREERKGEGELGRNKGRPDLGGEKREE